MKQKWVVYTMVSILLFSNIALVFLLVQGKRENETIAERETVQAYVEQAEAQGKDAEGEKLEQISSNTDIGLVTEAAVVAKVGYPITFYVPENSEVIKVEIAGENGYVQYPEKIENGFEWTPNRAGVFNINALDSEAAIKFSRQINVSGINDTEYYQLQPIEVVENEDGLSFATGIFSIPNNGEAAAQPVTGFSIGEAGIWSKTVKGYDNDSTKITEGEQFKLSSGSYYVRAALRDKYSVADEDYKTIQYTRDPDEAHQITIDSIDHVRGMGGNGTEVDYFTVNANCKSKCDLVYAFFISDQIDQKRLTDQINGYSESNTFSCPATSWAYTVTVKVKHKEGSDFSEGDTLQLPNGYEAVDTITIAGQEASDAVKIKNIEIEPFILSEFYKNGGTYVPNKEIITSESQKGTVYVNNNNYITINLEDEDEAEYVFSATVKDDDESIILEKVEDDINSKGNKFVYYPRSGGKEGVAQNPNETHLLTITVSKANTLGYTAYKVTKSIELEVE